MSASAIAPIRVLVVQDHLLLATAIARVLKREYDLVVCGIARDGKEAVRIAAQETPSVVLMDFRLPDVSGPAAAANIKLSAPDAAIVFHSADETETSLLDAIDAGAMAYLTKSATADEIVDAVRKASTGEVQIPVELFAKAIARQRQVVGDEQAARSLRAQFTPREIEVLRLLAHGHSTEMIGDTLGIAPHTVAWHVRHLIEKLAVHSKLQAVIAAVRGGLIDLD